MNLTISLFSFVILQLMLQENERVRKKIPAAFEPLMGPHLSKLDRALDPGLYRMTWTSINIEGYIENVHAALGMYLLNF